MGFDIKKERIRFRRQDSGKIMWEIPELDRHGFAGSPGTALSNVRDIARSLCPTARIAELKAKIEDKHVELSKLLNLLAALEGEEPSTLPELIEEQGAYLERALKLLEPGALFGTYTVKLVGVLDVGDEDRDGDLDFKVTLGW